MGAYWEKWQRRGWGQEGREGQVGQRACGIDRGVLEGEMGQGGKSVTGGDEARRERETSGTEGVWN